MARNYGIPGRQASPVRADQEQPAKSSHSERFKMILETLGWFAFMLMMTAVFITFGQDKIMAECEDDFDEEAAIEKLLEDQIETAEEERMIEASIQSQIEAQDEAAEEDRLIEEQIQTQIEEEEDFKDV